MNDIFSRVDRSRASSSLEIGIECLLREDIDYDEWQKALKARLPHATFDSSAIWVMLPEQIRTSFEDFERRYPASVDRTKALFACIELRQKWDKLEKSRIQSESDHIASIQTLLDPATPYNSQVKINQDRPRGSSEKEMQVTPLQAAAPDVACVAPALAPTAKTSDKFNRAIGNFIEKRPILSINLSLILGGIIVGWIFSPLSWLPVWILMGVVGRFFVIKYRRHKISLSVFGPLVFMSAVITIGIFHDVYLILSQQRNAETEAIAIPNTAAGHARGITG